VRLQDGLSFHHVLRELNVNVDELSKEVLQLQRGSFGYYEYFEGVETEAMEFRLSLAKKVNAEVFWGGVLN